MTIDCSKCPYKRGIDKEHFCCGLITFPVKFLEERKDKFQASGRLETVGNEGMIITEDLLCVFLNRQTKLCEIYFERPEVCFRFGTEEALLCPHFKPNGNPWSEAKKKHNLRILDRKIDKLFKQAGVMK